MRFKKIILIVLLALFCVGGMELAFCAAADPERFEAVTAPAIALAERAYSAAQTAGEHIRSAASDAADAVSNAASNAASAVRQKAEQTSARVHTLLSTRTVLDPAGEQVQTLCLPQTGDAPEIEWLEAAEPSVTELVTVGGRELLIGGLPIVYYNQKDEAWAEASFGGDPIGRYGCGPTTMAMAVSSMTSTDIDPAEMAEWCAAQGYRAVKSGSYLSIVAGTASAFGLACTSLPTDDPDALRQALADGGVAVALMGPGHFTTGGHFILLHGVTETGEILVADPNSRENSLALWDAQLILDELRHNKADGGPLWLLTASS